MWPPVSLSIPLLLWAACFTSLLLTLAQPSVLFLISFLIDYLINMLIVWAGSKCDQRFIYRRRMGEIRGTLFFSFNVCVWGVSEGGCVYNKDNYMAHRWRGSLTDGVWTKMCWQCLSRSSRTRWPQVDMERNRFTSPVSRSVLFSPEERV